MSSLLDWHKSLGDVPSRFERLLSSPLFTNPLNIALLLLFLYIFLPLILPVSPHSSALTPSLSEARDPKRMAGGSHYSFLPAKHAQTTVWRKYTPRTLAVHDGSSLAAGGGKGAEEEGGKILLAIGGKVFDVTKGANFYGPGGPYGNFAGRDASRGMAKQSFDLDMLTPLDKPIDLLEDLTQMEIANMREWMSHFTAKYGIVGELVNEGEQGHE